MPIKITIDNINKEILKLETIVEPRFKEVIVDFDITDNIVIDKITGEIVKVQESTQGKEMIESLKNKKKLNDSEKLELDYLLS